MNGGCCCTRDVRHPVTLACIDNGCCYRRNNAPLSSCLQPSLTDITWEIISYPPYRLNITPSFCFQIVKVHSSPMHPAPTTTIIGTGNIPFSGRHVDRAGSPTACGPSRFQLLQSPHPAGFTFLPFRSFLRSLSSSISSRILRAASSACSNRLVSSPLASLSSLSSSRCSKQRCFSSLSSAACWTQCNFNVAVSSSSRASFSCICPSSLSGEGVPDAPSLAS